MAAKETAKRKSDRLRRLVSHGYFAPELPPCFVSHDLAKHCNSILTKVDALPVTGRIPGYYKFISEPASFYFPRFGKEDRRHGVPNAIAHLLLSRVLSTHYVEIRRIARKSKLTLSPPVFDWHGSRALSRTDIQSMDDFRVKLSSIREDYVAADVRAFYHSIYTHAIAWAIQGKQNAKRKRKPDDHYSNLIDLLCRNAQDGQTIGLPVGPDTSRLIAEVVASAVDVALQKRLRIGRRDASRYVDDYTISSPDDADGEELLAALRECVAAFELELNAEKSAIHSTSISQNTGWQTAVRKHLPELPRGARVKTDLVQQYLYQVGRLSLSHPYINVEKFGIQSARGALVNAQEWEPLQFSLINAYRRNPSLIPLLVEVCLLRQVAHRDVQTKILTEFLEHRLPMLARANRTGEIIWLLFMANRLRLELSAKHLKPLSNIQNAFIALLTLHLERLGLVQGNVDSTNWNRSLNSQGLLGPMWLYAYEAAVQGFVPDASTAFIKSDPYFGLLYSKGVQFLRIGEGYSSIMKTLHRLKDENERLQRLREALQFDEFEELEDQDDAEDEAFNGEFESTDAY